MGSYGMHACTIKVCEILQLTLYLSHVVITGYVPPPIRLGLDHLSISDHTPHPQAVKELHIEDVTGNVFYVHTINSMSYIQAIKDKKREVDMRGDSYLWPDSNKLIARVFIGITVLLLKIRPF